MTKLIHGDCLEVLRSMPNCSVDAVVTDPPYGLSFMGKKWDYDVPGVEVWAECLRVLKPGGHLLAFAGTRTQHRMAVRIEDAGFEIRDMIAWVYGSGFPKSHNLKGDQQGWGTALKPALEPITVARKPLVGTVAENVLQYGTGAINVDGGRVGTDDVILFNRKPEGLTISGWKENNRNPYEQSSQGRWPANFIHDGSEEATDLLKDSARFFYCAKASKADRDAGLDSIEIISIFAAWEKEDLQVRLLVDTATSPPRVTVESTVQHKNASAWSTLLFGSQFMERFQTATKYTTSTEISSTIASRTLRALAHCITSGYIPGVSCVKTDGTNHAVSAATSNTLTITIDEATASVLGANPAQSRMQFRISANDGRNIHSTVKPTDLMRYLCRLVTPSGGVVLDPFMGSGSTGKARHWRDLASLALNARPNM